MTYANTKGMEPSSRPVLPALFRGFLRTLMLMIHTNTSKSKEENLKKLKKVKLVENSLMDVYFQSLHVNFHQVYKYC